MKRYQRAALIGTGMIGGSLFSALKEAGAIAHAVGFDARREVAERARSLGIVDEVAASIAEAARAADLIVLAVPVRATESICEALAPALSPQALVTDVGSTKREVLLAVFRALPFPERFVGAHPIAGTERSGPEAADRALFSGRRCLLTPAATTRPEALADCIALWEKAGARVEQMDAAHHDRLLARVSHLPHVAAFALAAAVGRAETAGISAGGFADTTRIAASDPAMWRDVLLANRDEVLLALEALDEELGALRRAIAGRDGAKLESLIARAKESRRRVIDPDSEGGGR